jgi:AraC family transcriptional regulator, transcriptional activator of pobA
LFIDLLKQQFPLDGEHRAIDMRTASDFARQLNILVHRLNRAVKEASRKTTSRLVTERILQEAKILLTHSTWSKAELSDALGFAESTHFNNF